MSELIDNHFNNLLNDIQSGKCHPDYARKLSRLNRSAAYSLESDAKENAFMGKITLVAAPFLLACGVGLYGLYNHFATDTAKREAAVAANPATTTAHKFHAKKI